MKKTFFFSLLAIAMLTACSSDDQEEPKPTPRPMTVEVTENPFLDENGEPRKIATRGSVITTETLSAFSMNYQDSKYDFTKNTSGWSTISWPSSVGNNVKIDFYAYSDGTFNWNYGSPYVNFKVDAIPDSQRDLLVSKNNVAYSDHSGKVPVAFDHACAAIRLVLHNITETTFNLKSVKLSGIKDQGDYYYNADSKWQSLSGKATYTLNTSAFDLTANSTWEYSYLFLIPQTKVGISLTVDYNTDKSRTFSLNDANVIWQAGYEYTINLYMGSSFL